MGGEEVRSEDLFLVELKFQLKKAKKRQIFVALRFFSSLFCMNVKSGPQSSRPHQALFEITHEC
jgi:hypothetical protein